MTTSAQPLTPDDRLMAQHHLRSALGHFATGLTVNSFSSVSLERALVLCSLSTHSPNLDAFCDGLAHVMHVLSDAHKHLAYQLANPQGDMLTPETCKHL